MKNIGPFLSVFYYFLLLCVTTIVLATTETHTFSNNAFLWFDAAHYYQISLTGYEGFLQAFFPLFPLIWGKLQLSVQGVIALNSVLYFSSIIILSKSLNAHRNTLLIWLVIPSAIFYFLPYSEAFFFVGATIMLIGSKRNLPALTSTGFLICVLTRPAFTVLLPALYLMEAFQWGFSLKWILRIALYTLVAALGTTLVAVIQFQDTGEWFGFYHVQQGWGNALRLPSFPLTSWGGAPSVRLDAVALLMGFASGSLLIHRMFKLRSVKLQLPPELTLSLSYLFGISVFVLMMRGGELFSLNRFVFATPFFLVAIHYLIENRPTGRKEIALISICMTAFFLLFGSYVHIQTILSYLLITLYLSVFLIMLNRCGTTKRILLLAWVGLTFILQVYFFLRFLNGGWVA